MFKKPYLDGNGSIKGLHVHMILTRWRDLFILNKTVARIERKLIILKKKEVNSPVV